MTNSSVVKKGLRAWMALLVAAALAVGFVPSSAYAASESGASADASSTTISKANTSDKDMVIVLDAGHGGSESGATTSALREATLNLKLAKYCKKELEKYQGVKVVMTRSADKFVGLESRVKIAVKAGATVFVSLHCNSKKPTSTGFEVWVQNDSKYRTYLHKQSKKLGTNILTYLSEVGLKNCGTKESDSVSKVYPNGAKADRLSVLRNSRLSNLTAVLIEHGYLSGAAKDRELLSSDEALRAMAAADAQGIAETYGLSTEKLWAGVVSTSKGKLRWRLDDGTYQKNAWKSYNGAKYYFNKSGYAVKGYKKIAGKKYYFSSTYKMQKGWHKWSNGKYSYFSKTDGHQLFGKQKIGKKTYNFGKSGKVKKK